MNNETTPDPTLAALVESACVEPSISEPYGFIVMSDIGAALERMKAPVSVAPVQVSMFAEVLA